MKKLEIEYKSTKGFDKETIDVGFTIFKDDEKVAKISIDLTTKGKVGQGTTETSGKVSFEAEDVSFAIVIDSKVEYTDNVNVESINKSNANILNNMSEKEIERYFQDVVGELEDTLSAFGMKKNTLVPRKNIVIEDKETKETDITNNEENQNIEAEELEKQINELNERLKILQESNL